MKKTIKTKKLKHNINENKSKTENDFNDIFQSNQM